MTFAATIIVLGRRCRCYLKQRIRIVSKQRRRHLHSPDGPKANSHNLEIYLPCIGSLNVQRDTQKPFAKCFQTISTSVPAYRYF